MADPAPDQPTIPGLAAAPEWDGVVPAEWERLRAAVESYGYRTFLAGGALRDLDNGRPVKDLDLFVWFRGGAVRPNKSATETVEGITSALRGFGYSLAPTASLSISGEYIGSGGGLSYASEIAVEGFPPVQLLLMEAETAPAMVDRMDFGICQIGWTGDAVYRTKAYLADKADRAFTFMADKAQEARSLRRYDRLLAKYPGWSIRTTATA